MLLYSYYYTYKLLNIVYNILRLKTAFRPVE